MDYERLSRILARALRRAPWLYDRVPPEFVRDVA